MNIPELMRICMNVRERMKDPEWALKGDVLLVLRRKSPPTGENVRLFGRFGPLSACIANVQPRPDGDYDVVAYFSAAKILKYLEDHGEHDG